jgi:TetR/AcrR family tetracycline transcriptional repressor
VKLSTEVIARTALTLLAEVGLDGLTMRLVGKQLGVQASALYWHLKNKQELLDAMATIMFVEANENVEAPRRDEPWDEWIVQRSTNLRGVMLRYRDGARVMAGTNVTHSVTTRTTELVLRTLQDAGFPLEYAARTYPVVYHYTVGFTIEEQARLGLDYAENPYVEDKLTTQFDAARFPVTASALPYLFDTNTDAGFEHGLRIILLGMRAGVSSPDSAAPGDQ